MAETIPTTTTQTRHERDLRLVRETLSGDSDATAEFVERMQCVPAILATQNRRMGNPLHREDLADVVQETLTKVWKKLSTYAGRAALETWVYRFCYLEIMNGIRQRRRHPSAVNDEGELECLSAPSPPQATDFERLHRTLEIVGPPESDILRLKHFEELTFDEIAQRIGVSPNTAKTQYYRGLLKLKQLMASNSQSLREGLNR